MPHTRTHTSVFCRKQHSLFNYSWNGQLMPPHKTSRAHICSAFNQCVPQIALPAAPHSIVLILPRSLSLSIVIPIHSTSFPFPFPIPFPFTLSSSSSLSSSSFTLVSMAQTARTGIFTMYLSSPTHTHTHIHNRIHHPSSQPQLKRSVCIVSTKNKAPRAIFKRIGNNWSASAPDDGMFRIFCSPCLSICYSVQSTPTLSATTATATILTLTPCAVPTHQRLFSFGRDYFTFISLSNHVTIETPGGICSVRFSHFPRFANDSSSIPTKHLLFPLSYCCYSFLSL